MEGGHWPVSVPLSVARPRAPGMPFRKPLDRRAPHTHLTGLDREALASSAGKSDNFPTCRSQVRTLSEASTYMERANRYASELNEIQDTVLEAISVCRDEIEDLFAINSDEHDIVDYTLKRLFAYQSDRSQTISYLVSSNYLWDAEIILRSLYETHAKIWFICLEPTGGRENLVQEFWGDYAKMHANKKAARAKPGAELFARISEPDSAAMYEALSNDKVFDFHKGNKQERKSLEQKWSFSEIIERLERSSDILFPISGVSVFKHMYGIQSHLVVCEEPGRV